MYRKNSLDHSMRDAPWWCNSKTPKELSFRSVVFSREETAVSLPAANRFLADESGFGMTKGWFCYLNYPIGTTIDRFCHSRPTSVFAPHKLQWFSSRS
jgi:hypothetical protein